MHAAIALAIFRYRRRGLILFDTWEFGPSGKTGYELGTPRGGQQLLFFRVNNVPRPVT